MALNKFKFRLIEEVRQRPILWDLRSLAMQRSSQICDAQWKEIGNILNEDAMTCKRTWIHLRMQFCNEMKLIKSRISKAKMKGSYAPNKKYYCWAFYDCLRFVANGLSPKAKIDLSFENDSDIEIVENDNKDQIKPHFINHSSVQNESENTYTIIPVDDSDDSRAEGTNFKSYRVSLSSCVQDNECTPILNTNLQSFSAVKEDPEFQIVTENRCLEYQHINELQNGTSSTLPVATLSNYLVKESEENEELEEFISCPLAVNCQQNDHGPSTFPDEHLSLPDLNDEDYSFLYSFLSQTKVMTQLQKMEFRANMKKLLVHTFPDAASVNILEKQLLLSEDTDPDRKFLISFWPFIKSMSSLQNLQFRAKMANLMSQSLSSESV